MSKRVRVEYDTNRCIGAGQCAAIDPQHFALKQGKAVLTPAKQQGTTSVYEGACTAEEAERLERAAASCPSNAIRMVDLDVGKETVTTTMSYAPEFRELPAQYDDAKEFVFDPNGYFLIRISPERKEIEVAFCTMRNQISCKVAGKTPLEIYQTVLKQDLISRMDHAAYLCRELLKAYDALRAGLPYVQDDELKFS